MTVIRFLCLFLMALLPATVWGQGPVGARPEMNSGLPDQFETDALSGGPFEGIPAGYQVGDQAATGLIPRQDGALPPSITPQAAQSGIPPELLAKPRQRFQPPLWQTTARGGYFAIMGAVSRPGVYYLKTERTQLNDVVQLAGGPAEDAGGGVRIVRQGHGGLQTFLSSQSRYELLNGDVVVLESKLQPGLAGLQQHSAAMQSTVDRRANSTSAPSKPAPAASAYLAFVNLTSTPVIVPVPADQATLVNVMTWLRQDLKSPPAVRVIAPRPQLRRDERTSAEQQVLESGTVLVFDPTTVKRERLPGFPAVIGETGGQGAEPASPSAVPAAKSADPAARPVPGTRTIAPQMESPAGRATRTAPAMVPPPPAESIPQPAPRRTVGQQDQLDQREKRSALDGPMLMSPQRPKERDQQATQSEFDSHPTVAPANLEDDQAAVTTPGTLRQQRLSWQSRPGKKVTQLATHEVDEQGVVPAHAEREQADVDQFVGPALELPRPVPAIVREPALIPVQSLPSTSSTTTLPSSFSRQVVWFSLISMLLLVAILWWLLRWDGARPVHARVLAGRRLSKPADHRVAHQERSVLMAERQQIFRTDVTSPPADSKSGSAPEGGNSELPVLPPPIRTISQREHALRAHFRQAVQERGHRQPVSVAADEAEIEQIVNQPVPPPMPRTIPVASNPPAVGPSKSQDALQRALNMKRNSTPPKSQ